MSLTLFNFGKIGPITYTIFVLLFNNDILHVLYWPPYSMLDIYTFRPNFLLPQVFMYTDSIYLCCISSLTFDF